MQEQQQSNSFKRRRKFLLMVPLLAFPFLAMVFWALGGGKGDSLAKPFENESKGFNINLPGAHLKDDKGLNKLSFYREADRDSEKLKEKLRDDPYHKDDHFPNSSLNKSDSFMSQLAVSHFAETGKIPGKSSLGGINMGNEHQDPNEAKVYEKLDELNKAINTAGNPTARQIQSSSATSTTTSQNVNDNVSRLERMMRSIKQTDAQEDPQVSRINNMLDKIIAVQHPETIQDSIRERSIKSRGQVFPLVVPEQQNNISLFGSGNETKSLGNARDEQKKSLRENSAHFLAIDADKDRIPTQNTVEAIVPETQTLVNGSTVKLQLVNNVFINGVVIPDGTFIYGTANLSNERLKISISTIGYENSVFPVSLDVYDKSGMMGIYIPGAISRDVGKQSADEAINGLGLTSLDPSLGAQAASAGIQAAKSLLSKKVKLVRVTVKGNYTVLLKDNQK